MSKKDLVEKYGNPHLVWGYYPLSTEYNSGGCMGSCGSPKLPTEFDAARGEAMKDSMEQRGGNNAFHFMQHPGYTQHEVGTGCYNPNCHSPNCHGDSLCYKNGTPLSLSPRDPLKYSMNSNGNGNGNMTSVDMDIDMNQGMEDALTWIGMIAVAYFAYNLFIKRR